MDKLKGLATKPFPNRSRAGQVTNPLLSRVLIFGYKAIIYSAHQSGVNLLSAPPFKAAPAATFAPFREYSDSG